MNPEMLKKLTVETVSSVYPLFMAKIATERDIPIEKILMNSGVTEPQLRVPASRITVMQLAIITYNLLFRTKDPGLGMELGLRATYTKIGLMGFGLMSCDTFREALELGTRYLVTLVPFFSTQLTIEDDIAHFETHETRALDMFRDFAFDHFLTEAWNVSSSLLDAEQLKSARSTTEIWFDRPEPEYFNRYKAQMPLTRWGMPCNAIRFNTSLLNTTLSTANPVNARMVIEQCEREMAMLGYTDSLLNRVRSHLICRNGHYPSLVMVADAMHMSDRSLKRKLHLHGVTFLELLDEVRRRDSIILLQNPHCSIEDVSRRVGYNNPNNFARAFRKWTNDTPSNYRTRMVPPVASGT